MGRGGHARFNELQIDIDTSFIFRVHDVHLGWGIHYQWYIRRTRSNLMGDCALHAHIYFDELGFGKVASFIGGTQGGTFSLFDPTVL